VHIVHVGAPGRSDRALDAREEPTVEVRYTRAASGAGVADRKRGQDSAAGGA